MALIVLMEDDAATRTLVATVLRKDGHEVLATDNGVHGLALTEDRQPQLVISDVQMPQMNGFEMLAALRRNPALATTPVILLTSLQERAHMRIGMTSGADDYITKPFRPGELRDAVAAQLNKRQMLAGAQALAVKTAVHTALAEQRDQLAHLYEQRLAAELGERWPSGPAGSEDERFASATVLFADIPHYADVAGKLSAPELSELVKRFYRRANDTAHLFGARHIQFVGEGLLAVFTEDTDTCTVSHGLRAVRTATGLIESAHALRGHIDASYRDRALPPFVVHVALNSGSVVLTQLRDPLYGAVQKLPVGEPVGTAIQLQKQARALGWPIAAGVATLRCVTGAVRTGRRALLALAGRSQPFDAVELIGLAQPAAA